MTLLIISQTNLNNEDKILGYFIKNKIDLFKGRNFDFWSHFTSKGNDVNEKMGWYQHSLRLVLYFLCNFDKINNDFGKAKTFRYIVDNICNLGGDTDTNAAIVGGVLGPLIGYKNFMKELIIMLKQGRKVYYPIFMMLYLDYLVKSNYNNQILYDRKNFIKMIATIIYGKIDENKLFK